MTDATSFGPYLLLHEIGRGGQGTVWLAEDQKLKRKVALKVLSTAPGALTGDQIARFRREAEAASKLDHPNICGLLDAGEVDGNPYLAYRFVEGHTLAELIADTYARQQGIPTDEPAPVALEPSSRAGIERIVAVFEKLARALHVAHEKSLVHRDVKPGNVMVTPDGEPVLLDFGLARDELGDDLSLTHSGDLLGTPAYMSPEQLTAHRVPVDRRTDVYSLGATLYEALTLQKPFTGRTRAELYQRILAADPSSVSALNRQIPHDLRVVVETAIDKDRNRRYQTALDFAEDLRRFRLFEPVRARPIGRLLKARRWAQRQPVVATVLGSVLLLLTSGLALSLYFLDRVRAEELQSRAIALRGLSAQAADRDQMLSLLLALEAARIDPSPETLSELYRAATEARELVTFRAYTSSGHEITFSPDGERVLTAGGQAARLWALDGTLLREFVAPMPVTCADFAPMGISEVLVGAADGTALIFDAASGRLLRTLPDSGDRGALASVRYLDAGRLLTVVGTPAGWQPQDALHRVTLWDRDGTASRTVDPGMQLTTAVPSIDGSLVIAGWDGLVRVLDRDGTRLAELPHDTQITDVAASPDGALVLTACVDGRARLWKRDGQLLQTIRTGTDPNGVAFSPDGLWLCCATRAGDVLLHDLDGERRLVLRGHRDPVVSASFSPDGRLLATLSFRGTARVWDLSASAPMVAHVPARPDAGLTFDAWSRIEQLGDHGEVVERSRNGTVPIRNVTGEPLVTLRGLEPVSHCVAISADGSRIATCPKAAERTESTVRVWHRNGDRLGEFTVDHSVNALGFSRSGEEIVVTGPGSIEFWSRGGALKRSILSQSTTAIRSALVTPDGAHVLAAHWDGTIRVFDGATAEVRRTFRSPGGLASAAIDPSGTLLVTAGGDGVARVWDLTGTRITELAGHRGSIHAAAFSPDGERVATASADGTARVFDLSSKRTLAILKGHEQPVRFVRWAPDGKHLTTAGDDGTVRTWILDPDELIAVAEERRTRGFSPAEWHEYVAVLGAVPEAIEARERAEKYVAALFEGWFVRELVLDRIDTDDRLDDSARQLAVRIANATPDPMPNQLNLDSWQTVRTPGADQPALERAHRQAVAALALRRDDPAILNTLGAAEYRLGRYTEAIETLRRCIELRGRKLGADAAFLAMAHQHLGDREAARRELASMRDLMDPEHRGFSNARIFDQALREVIEVLGAAGQR